ncbi:hypothetical protein [Amycolatopsis alkalitolerans]|uniref:hypothetical protein n=1 Tax=Amycolatopsis alkalitolerans TaxID=2547244 RepID=UPI00190F0B70|nr:hypothetical protein [Amycolatopsis alkalitolerans]
MNSFEDLLAATESWPPNLAVAARNLRPLGARVVGALHDHIREHGSFVAHSRRFLIEARA